MPDLGKRIDPKRTTESWPSWTRELGQLFAFVAILNTFFIQFKDSNPVFDTRAGWVTPPGSLASQVSQISALGSTFCVWQWSLCLLTAEHFHLAVLSRDVFCARTLFALQCPHIDTHLVAFKVRCFQHPMCIFTSSADCFRFWLTDMQKVRKLLRKWMTIKVFIHCAHILHVTVQWMSQQPAVRMRQSVKLARSVTSHRLSQSTVFCQSGVHGHAATFARGKE